MSDDRPPYDLSKLSVKELRNSVQNFQKNGKGQWVILALKELDRRGAATRSDYSRLTWNQDAVKKALEPFSLVAKSVIGNKRTSYTEAGGGKFQPKDSPEKLWIDSYCAVKMASKNVVFGCHIEKIGDDPEFYIWVEGSINERFNADELQTALRRFSELAL